MSREAQGEGGRIGGSDGKAIGEEGWESAVRIERESADASYIRLTSPDSILNFETTLAPASLLVCLSIYLCSSMSACLHFYLPAC